jgi:VanZ family protein
LQLLNFIRISAWALAAAIVVLSLCPPELRPETGAPHDLEHFVIYAMTGLAFGLGYRQREILLAALLMAFTGLVELAQLFVPGRHSRLGDFIVDAIAVIFGVIAAFFVRRLGIVP